MNKNTKTILIVSGAVVVLYLLLKNRKDTTLIIEKQGGTTIIPVATPSVSTQPATPSVTTSGSTTGTGTGASTTQGSGGLTTADLSKTTTTTTTTTSGGTGGSTGVSVGVGKQDQTSASIPSDGITGADTPTGGGQVQDYARTSTGTAGGNVVVAFDGFMYSSNGKKLTLSDLIKN